MKTLFVIILFLVGAFWVTKAIVLKYNNAERKPFWNGVGVVQVCKKPYTSTRDCSYLNVTLLENRTVQINFNERQYLIASNLTCNLSASMYGSRYVFCRSWDDDGTQWDLLPEWVNYNL